MDFSGRITFLFLQRSRPDFTEDFTGTKGADFGLKAFLEHFPPVPTLACALPYFPYVLV